VEVRGIEDNRSAVAMANMEAFHVKGTRHVQNVVIHVENRALYLEAIQRSNIKFSALHLERLPVSPARLELIEPPSVDKGRLLLAAREWGKEFVGDGFLPKRLYGDSSGHHLSFAVAPPVYSLFLAALCRNERGRNRTLFAVQPLRRHNHGH
jgi:hypothetical protein